jgi:hypothetical protein
MKIPSLLPALVTVVFAVLAAAFVATAISGHAVDAAISVALNKFVGQSPLIDKALVLGERCNFRIHPWNVHRLVCVEDTAAEVCLCD